MNEDRAILELLKLTEEIDRLKGKSSGLTIADLMEQGKLLGAYDQAKALSIAFNTMDDLDEI